MPITQKATRVLRRALGSTPDATSLMSRLESISAQLAAQTDALNHLVFRFDSGNVEGFRREFDSLAAAQAEGMVYMNRTLREVRAEVLSLSKVQGQIVEGALPGKL